MIDNGTGRPDHLMLLEPRHVDNLTEAVRALNRTITQLNETAQKQLFATREASQMLKTAVISKSPKKAKASKARRRADKTSNDNAR